MVEWKLVLISGRLYISAYDQGQILLEIQMRMVLNEFLEKLFTYSFFFRSCKKQMGDFRFWVESDAWRFFFSNDCMLQLSPSH